jgi:hypothetical protein
VGDGLLLGVTRAEDSDTIHNVVVVQQEAGSPIRATVEDTDQPSPTYAGGKYGAVRSRSRTPTSAPISRPSRWPATSWSGSWAAPRRPRSASSRTQPSTRWDAITVHYPSADLHNTGLVTQTITYPLGVTESMQVVCRKFLLTEDGQQLDVPIEVTTS